MGMVGISVGALADAYKPDGGSRPRAGCAGSGRKFRDATADPTDAFRAVLVTGNVSRNNAG